MQSLVALITQFRGSHLETLLATTCLLLLPALAVAARRELATLIPRRSKRELGALLLVLAVALALRVHPMADPFRHRVYFDEWEYLESARSVLLHQRASICTWGEPASCRMHAQPSGAKIGYAVLLAGAFSLFGTSDAVAMTLTLVLSLASVALAWLLAAILAPGSRTAPLAAAVILATLPLHIRYASSAATDPVSLFFGGLAVLATIAASRCSTKRCIHLAAIALVVAVSIRYENILLLFPVMVVFGHRLSDLRPFVIGLVISFTLILAWASNLDVTGSTPLSIEPVVVARSVRSSLRLWIGENHHPLSLTALVLVALWRPPRERVRTLFIAWFVPFILLYAVHDWPMDRWNMDRHMLQGYLPFVLLATTGLAAAERIAGDKGGHLVALAMTVIVVSSLWTAYGCPGLGCPDRLAREVDFAQEHRALRPDCIIAAPTPTFITWTWERPAIYFERIDDVRVLLDRGTCVLLHEDFFCHRSEVLESQYKMPGICADYYRMFEVELVAEDTDGPYPIRLSALSLGKV